MKHRTLNKLAAYMVPVAAVALASVYGLGCAGVKAKGSGAGGSNGSGSGGSSSTGSGGSLPPPVMPESCNGPCPDFPPDPIMDPSAPANVTGMFGSSSGAAPCVTEPEDGSLFPNNWLRPRVRVMNGSAAAYKITFHADREANDLVAYTGTPTWALPRDVWSNLARHIIEEDITITVQAAGGGTSTVKFQIAPVSASGSMVFWSADPSQVGKQGVEMLDPASIVNDSYLLGFSVGDESTVNALKITDVQQFTMQQDGNNMRQAHCIGCHVGTPDGDYVAFIDAWPWPGAFAAVKDGITGQALPGFVGRNCTTPPPAGSMMWTGCAGDKTITQYPWAGPYAFSPAHWDTGDKIAIVASQMSDITMPWSTDNKMPGRLAWINVEQTATMMTNNGQMVPILGTDYGYLTRSGDTRAAGFPTWSHDGETIVYCSTACPSPNSTCGTQDGRLATGATDLYQVPYANKTGGAATAVPGASSSGVEEYYPAFSPDDHLLIFNTVPAGDPMYANDKAELSVLDRSTGTPTRLNANDPPACSGLHSPGINNHWAKWAPDVGSANSKTYYFAIFSSNRYGIPPVTSNYTDTSTGQRFRVEMSQLYITAIVRTETSIQTFPAIYLWNQPQDRVNRTPAWEKFNIPVVK